MAAAIANTLAHATGRRLRDLPFSPERVQTALVEGADLHVGAPRQRRRERDGVEDRGVDLGGDDQGVGSLPGWAC